MPATLNKAVAYVRRLSATEAAQDRVLLERFTRDEDEAAFAELVRRHGPMVLAACRRVLRHEQDAEDAFQAAFLVLARKAGSIQQDCIAGWLFQVAQRLALRAKTTGDRRRLHPLPAEVPANAVDASLGVAINEELAALPEPYRVAIVLCYLEGKSQAEAARELATTTDAVNSRLKRARELLRHRLARQGLVLSAAALTQALVASLADAALPTPTVSQVVRIAIDFITGQAVTGPRVALAEGALNSMISTKLKLMTTAVLALLVMALGAFWMPEAAAEKEPMPAPVNVPHFAALERPLEPDKKNPHRVIILWMTGGPSQIDTFDPKDGNVALFKSIDTSVKGMQFSELFPKLAKKANHLAVIRSVSHREGDHVRGGYLMRTGYAAGKVEHPSFGSILAKELGGDKPDVPRYFMINPTSFLVGGRTPGILGASYAPIIVGENQTFIPPAEAKPWPAPEVEKFDAVAKGMGKAHRDAVLKAFDLGDEKAEVRDAYGKSPFGLGCLLARRLVERGVPVVEVHLGGWDTHGNAAEATKKIGGQLDSGFSTLLKDLDEKKLLDQTLVVWMGEFGRTPRVNQAQGRDHYPMAFTAILAGAGVKGGQAIGKTSDDGTKVTERPVSPQELLATVYTAVKVDPRRFNRTPGGEKIPLVEKGNDPVKEALK